MLRSKLFTTHHTIKRQLKLLNESITYNVEREFNADASHKGDLYKGILNIGVGVKKKKSRLIADVREIEKELQDILSNVQKIPVYMARPEFVIVFDELDKVNPELLKKEENTQESTTKETMFAQDSTRDRQAVILKLLSNMKYFLYTANAKFIFIAGREMYDMYLADIADRNNHFGSIFNDVIFVKSFLSDNDRKYDITALTEEFVCHHLIPENYPTVEWNLKIYQKYLVEIIFEGDDEYQKKVTRKIQKIIATLQQFIIYLSHTSKGAPKKMIQVFENFISDFEPHGLDDRQLVVKQYRNTRFFLSFDYYNQFTIGMTDYLIAPIINRLTDSNIQEHSDKLLVSTLHFVDYMLKFHSHNFSWRQLDISPEVIETNHPPELKSIINDVVTSYEQIYLTKPIINLFDFKFDSLLSQEISFISKMDERFSAQFSFSLDESLALKQYYNNLLRKKQIEYKEFKDYGITFVSSISSLQIVLGDLHFLDDELEQAAIYYKDGIQLLSKRLREEDKNHENLDLFYLLIRNQLKLAYLYEKRKQPEFAYLLYGEIVKSLIKVRDFDLEDMGVSVREYVDGDFVLVKKNDYFPTSDYDKHVETPLIRWNEKIIYNNKKYANVRSMSFKQLTPKTQQIMYKNMTFEGLQLFYLPLLAKLQILEKRYFTGILDRDIKLIEREFEFLIRTINHQDIKILTADFYSKIGDILYYKNKVLKDGNNNKGGIEIQYYACYYYKKALIALVLEGTEEEDYFSKETILQILKDKAGFIYEKTSAKYCDVMARVLSNLGDVYFSGKEEMCNSSCKTEYCKKLGQGRFAKKGGCNNISASFWSEWHELFTNSEFKLDKAFLDKLDKNPLDNVELALFLYSLSVKFYKKANLYKQAAFQITKILNGFKYCLIEPFDDEERHIKKIKNFAKRKILNI